MCALRLASLRISSLLLRLWRSCRPQYSISIGWNFGNRESCFYFFSVDCVLKTFKNVLLIFKQLPIIRDSIYLIPRKSLSMHLIELTNGIIRSVIKVQREAAFPEVMCFTRCPLLSELRPESHTASCYLPHPWFAEDYTTKRSLKGPGLPNSPCPSLSCPPKGQESKWSVIDNFSSSSMNKLQFWLDSSGPVCKAPGRGRGEVKRTLLVFTQPSMTATASSCTQKELFFVPFNKCWPNTSLPHYILWPASFEVCWPGRLA